MKLKENANLIFDFNSYNEYGMLIGVRDRVNKSNTELSYCMVYLEEEEIKELRDLLDEYLKSNLETKEESE